MKKILTLTFVLTFSTYIYAQLPAYVPSTGLVAWWPFNGNAADSSGNSNNGTVNGATLTAGQSGLANNAYSFNGSSSYIAVPTNFANSFTAGKMSVSAWVYFNTNADWSSIIKNWGSVTTGAFHFGLSGLSQKLHLQITQSSGTTLNALAPATISLNAWHHVAFTLDGSLMHLYQDGVEVGTPVSYNGTLKTSFQFTNIGVKPGTSQLPAPSFSGYHNGKLDDIGVWSRALNQAEITALYNGSGPNSVSNLETTNLVNIQPNPSNGTILVNAHQSLFSASNTIQVINALGEVVLSEPLDFASKTVTITSGKGIYFLQVMDEHKRILQTNKVVVE